MIGLIINLPKYLSKTDVKFLAYLINEHGTKPLPENVEAIINLQSSKAFKALRRFLSTISTEN